MALRLLPLKRRKKHKHDNFVGPYKIAEVLSLAIYLLDLDGKSKHFPMVGSGQLKPCVPLIPTKPVLVREIITEILPSETRKGMRIKERDSE